MAWRKARLVLMSAILAHDRLDCGTRLREPLFPTPPHGPVAPPPPLQLYPAAPGIGRRPPSGPPAGSAPRRPPAARRRRGEGRGLTCVDPPVRAPPPAPGRTTARSRSASSKRRCRRSAPGGRFGPAPPPTPP